MSYLETLQSHNTRLSTLVDKANSLPEAGGGSGGASVETCTVTITNNIGSKLSWTDLQIGIPVVNSDGTVGCTKFCAISSGSPTYTNALANSVMFVTYNDIAYELSGETKITLTNITSVYSGLLYAYRTPGAGEAGTMVISQN